MNNENLGVIMLLLAAVLKTTRAGQNVADLLLENDYVKIVYVSGDTARIPIAGESGVQAIIDVCRALQ